MTRINKKNFKEACKGSGGVQTIIAKAIGVTRGAITKYLNKHPEMRSFVEEEGEKIMDVAEHNIDRDIVAGDVDSSKWALTNRKRGKARGYGIKQEFDVSERRTRIVIEKANDANNTLETKPEAGASPGSSGQKG